MLNGKNFSDEMATKVAKKKTILVGGLDPKFQLMPEHLRQQVWDRFRGHDAIRKTAELMYEFCCEVIEAIHEFIVAVKPNFAFFEDYGSEGIGALERVIDHANAFDLLVIGDGKRGDGGDSAQSYADAYIGEVPVFGESAMDNVCISPPLKVDALTVEPYIADACVCQYVERVKKFGKGIFVVTKTSFKPNSAVEQLKIAMPPLRIGNNPVVWQEVALMAKKWGEGTEGACGLANVGVVMGATYPEDAPWMRRTLPNAWFLIPGYGAQGGGASGAVVGIRKDGLGGVVNSSRGIIFAYLDKEGKPRYRTEESEKWIDFVAEAARSSCEELVTAARAAGKWPF